ncbi:MAG: hypothetical protein M3Z32_04680 [Acidobacteriota bacterium]|nr:hypothetical protein [Acidobacteriota bacterium]
MRSHARRAGTVLLVVLLSHLHSKACDPVQDCVTRWTSGRRIELVLTTNEKVTGRLGAVQPNGFVLKSGHRGDGDRQFRFAEVGSVKTKMTVGQKWAIAGAVYGVLTVMGLILGK